MTETSPAREKRSNTAHLFIRAVPAERRFICRKRQQTEPKAGDSGRRVLALSGQGAGTRGSAGQAPSLSQLHHPFTGRPRVPAKLRPGFAQPRWPPRIYKKARYRNISSACRSNANPQGQGSVPSCRGVADGGDVSRGSRSVGSGRGAAAGGGGTRSPARRSRLPTAPAGVTAGTGARLGKQWEASPAGWSKVRREGDTQPLPSRSAFL